MKSYYYTQRSEYTKRKDINGESVKSLESTYRGVVFRSRMEARWAAYFDLLFIEWQYEPEGFELPSGNYCPDFQIRKIGSKKWSFVEVKPCEEAADFIEQKLIDLSLKTLCQCFLLIGNPQEAYTKHRLYEYDLAGFAYGAFSWGAWVYKAWGTLDFCGEYDHDGNDGKALSIINSMRFENGKCPKRRPPTRNP